MAAVFMLWSLAQKDTRNQARKATLFCDLWNFSAGAMARSSSRGAGGGAGDAASTELPRIQSPYNVQAMGKLAPTSLSQEQSRKLYGSTKVPGVDDDDDVWRGEGKERVLDRLLFAPFASPTFTPADASWNAVRTPALNGTAASSLP